MSHFYTIALVEPSEAMDIEGAVQPLLAPYDENMEVDDYEDTCYCVGHVARMEVHDQVKEAMIEHTVNSLADLRNEHSEATAGLDLDWEESSKRWQEFTKDWFDLQEKLQKQFRDAHPLINEPDKDCDECGGDGVVISTYNPDSKWDWYQVGGRWSGQFDSDYDPATDPDNIETCFICRGTGMRNDTLGQEARAKDPNYTCNGCGGKGTSVKWPTQWKNDRGNIESVSNLLKLEDEKFSEVAVPFAIVSKDGWAERGSMGWFASVSDEKDKDDWNTQVRSILEANTDKLAVVLDLHI
jgi:hypothetical protein